MKYNIILNNFIARFPEHLMETLVTLLELEAWSQNILHQSEILWLILQV